MASTFAFSSSRLFTYKPLKDTPGGVALLLDAHGVVFIQVAFERLNREIRRRTRVVGTFPDGNFALMLVCARLRHMAGTQWGNKKYMNMKHLEAACQDDSVAG